MPGLSDLLQSGSLAYSQPSPSSVAARRALAEQLLKGSVNNSMSPLGALAQTLGGSFSGFENSRATQDEEMGQQGASSALAAALQGDPSFESLSGIAGNPWLNQGQSGLVNTLLGKEIGQMYPDPVQPTANMRDFQFAQENPGFQDFLGGASGGDQPATLQEWAAFSQMTPEQQQQYLIMKRASPYLDLGTGYGRPDPLNPGNLSGPEIPKDNFTPAYDAAVGGGQGKVDVETQAAADSLSSKLPGLQSVVGELGQLAKTATYTQTGQLIDNIIRETGQTPPDSAIARTKYIAMVDNQVLPLLRDTFGAAFTVKEGETLRATLGDPNKSPVEKQAILEAFIEQKVRDLAALESRLPQQPTQNTAPVIERTYNPVTGRLE
jgi:hypothetical protein